MTLEIILVAISVLYAAEYLFFRVGIARAMKIAGHPDTSSNLPKVSVIVAARNEELLIERCVASLLAQSYPEELLELIIVDDASEDRTGEILRLANRKSGGRLKLIETTPETSGVEGKPRAIAQGADSATGEYILLTDADCAPSSSWVRATVAHFQHGADVVAGFTLVDGSTFFGRMQQLDWLHLQSIASASMAFDSPVGVVGNNLSFHRDAYERVGGYRELPFSITEDFSLFLALIQEGCQVVFPCDPSTRVVTAPCPDLQTVLRQKHRWGRGGMESTPHGYSIIVVAFLMLCAICIAPFVSPLAWGVVWGTKFLADLMFLVPVMRRLKVNRVLRYFPPFQFYFLAQALIVPLMIINPRVSWKGRVFTTARGGVSVD